MDKVVAGGVVKHYTIERSGHVVVALKRRSRAAQSLLCKR